MELIYLPRTDTAEKKYRHYTINTSGVKEFSPEKKGEFFYIGRDNFIIDILVQSFESGYASENVHNALGVLTKVIEKRSAFPNLIVVDATVGVPALTALSNFISASPYLRNIPFLVDATGAEIKCIQEIKQLPFVDEIIFMHLQSEKLLTKLHYIRKIKDAGNLKELQENIMQSLENASLQNDFLKRMFDIVITSILLILLSPVFLLIALAVKLESGGPVFYISKRAGRGYRVFNFYKFRTMQADADTKVEQLSHLNQYNKEAQSGPVFFKVNNDPRITRVGTFLRNSSLDELPQLFNVLLGDMSLVGNRPLPLYEAEALTTDSWAERFMAPAGITGLWQIKKRGQEDMSVEERIGLDIAYANRNNFLYDLWIMANTPTAIIQKSNA